MSGLSGGLAPIGNQKPKARASKDAGAALDDILARKPKTSSYGGMDDSFDSMNSTSLASETSLPSPTPAKGMSKGGKDSSPDNYFNRSQDLGDSVQDLESSTSPNNDFGGYVPSKGVGSNTGAAGKSNYTLESSFDSSYDEGGSPLGQKRPATTGGIMGSAGQDGLESSSTRPYTAGAGGDNLEASDGGYNPVASVGGRTRQRRNLHADTTEASQSNVAASLDELDKALGFGGGGVPVAAAPAPKSRLAGYDSSDDEGLFRPGGATGAGAGKTGTTKASVPPQGGSADTMSSATRVVKEEEVSDAASSTAAGVAQKKNLRVNITDLGSSADSDTEMRASTQESAASSGSGSSDLVYDPGSTPHRAALRTLPAAAAASSPAWLGAAPSPSNAGVRARSPQASGSNWDTSGGMGSSANNDKLAGQTIRNMQQHAESAQLEHEAVERQLRVEIENLKRGLARSNMGLQGVSDDQIKDIGEGSMRQMRETADLKRQIAQQDMELARLRDEATLIDYKHREEMKLLKERHNEELKDADKRRAADIISVEKRHEETVHTLKRVHLEELDSIKERSKENSALDALGAQLKSATGSIKLLEEQLLSKYRGLDAAKDGQMEARERLLAEMEDKARSRVDTAESESYRLKGLLMHMEHVAGTLRSQGGEEKERLRQEHQRLHSLQIALEAERNAFQLRVTEELQLLKKKMEEVEVETKRLNEDKREQLNKLTNERRALETDRAEFSTYVMNHTKGAEAAAEQFKDEERRILRLKDEVERDRVLLDQRKSAAAVDIQEADRIRSAVATSKEEVAREKAKLQQAVGELNSASLNLASQGEAMEKLKRVLDQREIGIREANAQMKIAASKLKHREDELKAAVKDFEGRMRVLAEQDKDLTRKRTEMAKKMREMSSSNAEASITSHQLVEIVAAAAKSKAPSKANSSSTLTAFVPTDADPASPQETAITEWMQDFKARLDKGRQVSTNSSKSVKVVDAHILEAKRSLLASRGNLVRSNASKGAVDRLLSDDSSFVSFLQGQRARASWAASNQDTK